MFGLLTTMPPAAVMLYSGMGKANESIYANNFGNGKKGGSYGSVYLAKPRRTSSCFAVLKCVFVVYLFAIPSWGSYVGLAKPWLGS